MIRSASLEDESDLRTLCTSVYEDDYVLDHLSAWLAQKIIYVYQENDSITGMIRLTFTRDGKAHVGPIRVHPDFRRQGIGTALTDYCIATCRTDTVRLAIMDNNPSQALAKKMGFSQVGTFTFLLRTVEKTEKIPPVHVKTRTPVEALSLLRNSTRFIQNNSFLSSSFTFYTPSLESMEDLLFFGHKDKLAVLDFEIEEALKKAVQVAYCDFDPVLVKAILYEAARREIEEIWAVIPKNEDMINLLLSENFEPVKWGKTIRVFEQHV